MKLSRPFQLLASFGAVICVAVNALSPEEAANRNDFNDARSLEGEEYDCEKGCSLDPDAMGPPVCGFDDLTYFNKCIAICQGIEVAKDGPCRDHASERGPDDSFEKGGRVDAEVLRRYKSEGMKFVGKRKFVNYDPRDIERAEAMQGEGVRKQRKKKGKKKGKLFFRVHRITPEGYEYMKNVQKPSKSAKKKMLKVLPPFDTEMGEYDDEGDKRHLVTLGQDTRQLITTTTSFPFRIVGQLDLGSGTGGCSGTVIGRRAVVTAGHCLFKNGVYNGHTTFAPARTRVNGQISQPYGEFAWSEINYFIAWRDNQVREYDIAVVKYHPKSSGQYLGDVVGYAGIRMVSSTSPYLDNCQIRGYPGDKNLGEMWTSGTCPGDFGPSGKSKIVKYFCDTTPGMSGSGLMDSSGYVHGVHSFGVTNEYNGGIILSGSHYSYVKEWAER